LVEASHRANGQDLEAGRKLAEDVVVVEAGRTLPREAYRHVAQRRACYVEVVVA